MNYEKQFKAGKITEVEFKSVMNYAKAIVNDHAETSRTFMEFETRVRQDLMLKQMISLKLIKILIQQHSHELQ